MKCLNLFMKFTIFTKYLIESLKILIEKSIRPCWKGENHTRPKEKYVFENYCYLGVSMAPQNDLILRKWSYWGPIYTPKWKYFSNKCFSFGLVWFSPFQNGLVDYSMNIFSNLIRYFVKMVIFIKKYRHFRRWKK